MPAVPMGTIIRGEKTGDERMIHELVCSAFPTDQEALLVDRLRENGRLLISLVAEVEGTIVGQIAFSPATIKGGNSEMKGAGLAPIAVLPQWQRRGIGAQLVGAGLTAGDAAGSVSSSCSASLITIGALVLRRRVSGELRVFTGSTSRSWRWNYAPTQSNRDLRFMRWSSRALRSSPCD